MAKLPEIKIGLKVDERFGILEVEIALLDDFSKLAVGYQYCH